MLSSPIEPKLPAFVVQVGALSTLINPLADVPAKPVEEVTLTLYGSCAFKNFDLGATAVICVALSIVVVSALKDVLAFPTKEQHLLF